MRDEASKPDGVWDEYDWERFLQQQDRKTERYLKLLEQYLDHPQRDEIIAREMGWSHLLEEDGQDWAANLEQLFAADEDDDEEFDAMPLYPEDGADELFDEEEADDEESLEFESEQDEFDDEMEFDEEDEEAEAFESHPIYLSAMALTSWIDQSIHEHEHLAHEPVMVRMATHAAITASKVAAALTDGGSDELGMTIAYLKRGLFAINTSLDSLMQIQGGALVPADDLDRIRTGIFETRNGIVDLIGECRTEWRNRYGSR